MPGATISCHANVYNSLERCPDFRGLVYNCAKYRSSVNILWVQIWLQQLLATTNNSSTRLVCEIMLYGVNNINGSHMCMT